MSTRAVATPLDGAGDLDAGRIQAIRVRREPCSAPAPRRRRTRGSRPPRRTRPRLRHVDSLRSVLSHLSNACTPTRVPRWSDSPVPSRRGWLEGRKLQPSTGAGRDIELRRDPDGEEHVASIGDRSSEWPLRAALVRSPLAATADRAPEIALLRSIGRLGRAPLERSIAATYGRGGSWADLRPADDRTRPPGREFGRSES